MSNMLKGFVVRNFRSLAQLSIGFPDPYCCVVGDNNSGKSNIVTALRWLCEPDRMNQQGIPSTDLPRVLEGLTTEFRAAITLAGPPPQLPGGDRLVDSDGCISVAAMYHFEGGPLPQPYRGFEVQSEYAPLRDTYILVYPLGATPLWKPFPYIGSYLPQLVNIRPADIGAVRDDGSGEARLAQLRWPDLLTQEDLDWVNMRLGTIFAAPSAARLAVDAVEPSIPTNEGVLILWDEYGYPLPLRKAGSAVKQVAYTLLRIAYARKQATSSLVPERPLLMVIDEPEQHLTSGLQKNYADSLRDLSRDMQIIVLSHSGLFLNRDVDGATIVTVRGDRNGTTAIPQRRVDTLAVRATLGINIADSLMYGEVSLLVEGPTETIVLPVLFKSLAAAGHLPFDPARVTITQRDGASRIPAYAHFLAQLGLPTVVLLDNDQEGRHAHDIIARDSALRDIPVLLVPLNPTQRDAEFEDLFPPDLILPIVNELLATRGCKVEDADFISLDVSAPYWPTKKWADRLEQVLRNKGCLARNQSLEAVISKATVAAEVAARISAAQIPTFIANNLVPALEQALQQGAQMPYPIVLHGVYPPGRATTWVHPTSLADTIDHDV